MSHDKNPLNTVLRMTDREYHACLDKSMKNKAALDALMESVTADPTHNDKQGEK